MVKRFHESFYSRKGCFCQCFCCSSFFYKNWPPRPLFHLFSSLQILNKFYNKYVCKKCPSSIWCRDSNSRPLKHESPSITTRPGLPPKVCCNTTSQPPGCSDCCRVRLLQIIGKFYILTAMDCDRHWSQQVRSWSEQAFIK